MLNQRILNFLVSFLLLTTVILFLIKLLIWLFWFYLYVFNRIYDDELLLFVITNLLLLLLLVLFKFKLEFEWLLWIYLFDDDSFIICVYLQSIVVDWDENIFGEFGIDGVFIVLFLLILSLSFKLTVFYLLSTILLYGDFILTNDLLWLVLYMDWTLYIDLQQILCLLFKYIIAESICSISVSSRHLFYLTSYYL